MKTVTHADFEIFEKINECGSSRARSLNPSNTNDKDIVVIKQLKPLRSDAKTQNATLREAARLYDHLSKAQGVEEMLNFYQHDKRLYLVLEYLGENVKNLQEIADERSFSRPDELAVLSAEEITILAYEMIGVLAQLHSQSPPIKHGDIKPANIVFSKSDSTQFKLIDFSNVIGEISGSSNGSDFTPAFMSPELILKVSGLSTAPLTPANDMWAFAALLVDLSLGFKVRDSERPADTDQNLKDGKWNFNKGVIAQLSEAQQALWKQQGPLSQEIMRTCLSVNPSARPSAVDLQSSAVYNEVGPLLQMAALKKENSRLVEENTRQAEIISQLQARLDRFEGKTITRTGPTVIAGASSITTASASAPTTLSSALPPPPVRSFKGNKYQEMKGHDQFIMAVFALPHGHLIASGGMDGQVRIWDSLDNSCVMSIACPSPVWALLSLDDQTILAGLENGDSLEIDLSNGTGSIVSSWQGHELTVIALCLLPDGLSAVSASYDGTIRLWDSRNGRCLAVLEGHTMDVFCLVLVPVTSNGHQLAVSGSLDTTLILWDLTDRKAVKTLTGHTSFVFSVACLSSDRIVSGTGSYEDTANMSIRLWDINTGSCLMEMKHNESINRLVVLSRNIVASGSGEGKIIVWQVSSGKKLQTLAGHEKSVSSLCVLRDGRLVSGSLKALRIWS